MIKSIFQFLRTQLRSDRGFTLVEVLMAIALFMALIISLVGVGRLSVKASRTARLRVRAVTLARETMETVLDVRANSFGMLSEGVYHPEIVEGKWALVDGPEIVEDVEDFERRVEIYRVQRELSCGGERVCPIVKSGGVVDPVTFRAKVFVEWQENQEQQQVDLESLLTFWR